MMHRIYSGDRRDNSVLARDPDSLWESCPSWPSSCQQAPSWKSSDRKLCPISHRSCNALASAPQALS